MDTTLEKRVLSRLNAQYVFMPSVSGDSICEFLHNKLLLPETHFTSTDCTSALTSPALKRKANQIMSPPIKNIVTSDRSTMVSATFGEAFNKQIYEIFGTYTDTPGKKSANRTGQETSDESQDTTESSLKRCFVPGSMKDVICMHASWGVDFE